MRKNQPTRFSVSGTNITEENLNKIKRMKTSSIQCECDWQEIILNKIEEYVLVNWKFVETYFQKIQEKQWKKEE